MAPWPPEQVHGFSREYWRRYPGPDHDPAPILRMCYLAAGNRRTVRAAATADGGTWVLNLAADSLGWQRGLTEDGD
eukprot:14307501-Alexandrium_andersonii.AAC.1